MLITPSQALLLLMRFNKDNDLIYTELKQLFLLDASEISTIHLSSFFTDTYQDSFKITDDPELIKTDASRNYFETQLLRLRINLKAGCQSESAQNLIDTVFELAILFNEDFLRKASDVQAINFFNSSSVRLQGINSDLQTVHSTENSTGRETSTSTSNAALDSAVIQHSSKPFQLVTKNELELPNKIATKAKKPLNPTASSFSTIPSVLFSSFYNLFTLTELYSSVILISKHIYREALVYTVQFHTPLKLYLSKPIKKLRQNSLEELRKEYAHFIDIIKPLVIEPESHVPINQSSSPLIRQLSVPLTIRLINLLESEPNKRLEQLLTSDEVNCLSNDYRAYLQTIPGLIALLLKPINVGQISLMPTANHLRYFLTNIGVHTLIKCLVTPEEVAECRDDLQILFLFNKRGIITALERKLLTLKQIMSIRPYHLIESIVSFYGLMALSEGLISFEQMCNKPDLMNLDLILTQVGLEFLRKKIVTVEQIYGIENSLIPYMITSECLYLLENAYITLNQLELMPKSFFCNLNKWTLIALEEKHITIDMLKEFSVSSGIFLFTKLGIQVMREQRISAKQAFKMRCSDLENFLKVEFFKKAPIKLPNKADVRLNCQHVVAFENPNLELVKPAQLNENRQNPLNSGRQSYDAASIKSSISRAFAKYSAFQQDFKIGKVSALGQRNNDDYYGYFTWLRHGFFRGGLTKANVFNDCYGEKSPSPLNIQELRNLLLSQHANHRHSFATYVLDELRDLIGQGNSISTIQPLSNGRYPKHLADKIFEFLGLDSDNENVESVRNEWINTF